MTIDYYQASKRESWRRDLTAVETGANPGGNAAAGESVEGGGDERAPTFQLFGVRANGESTREKSSSSPFWRAFLPRLVSMLTVLRFASALGSRPRRRNWSPASLWVHLHSSRDAMPMLMPFCWLTGKGMAAGFGRWSKMHQRFQEMSSTLPIPTTVMC